MEFISTAIPEVILIKPKVFGDERGFFLESYKKSLFHANGITEEFIQDNHSKSSKGVLRGLHYQLDPKAQGKLVRCVAGAVFDVAVDIRRGSPTFGKWVGFELSAENKHMLWIPAGFAHGFVTLEDNTEFLYKTTGEYAPECDRGIRYDDPEIGIIWPIIDGLLLSDKDLKQPLLQNTDINFVY
ncbi:MAG: dTDP-4-dehydrorhamnose 3,5-epimerase [Proteobacteria bacterium]|nr:MAG: dTDP-4-dehydrorhamnose 3,5-epimerase [Pseudomonadota bacterium]